MDKKMCHQILVDFKRLHNCTEEEKDSAIEVVDLILSLGDEARRKGLLHLENMAGLSESSFLQKAVKLIVSGTDPESVRRILSTYILATELTDIDYFRRILTMDGLLLIQQGVNPEVLMEHLYAYFGESYIKKFLERGSKDTHVQQKMGIYMKKEIDNTNSPDLDHALKSMDMRSMQRLLRACDLSTISIACAGASKQLRQMVVHSIAIAQWSNYLEVVDIFDGVTLPMIRSSQAAIIKVMHQLRQAGEIL